MSRSERDRQAADARKAREKAEELKARALAAERLASKLEQNSAQDEKAFARRNYRGRRGHGWGERARARRKQRSGGNLYRDSRRAKILGVCAGIAEYTGFATWQVRLAAVLGLVFASGITIPAYLVAYVLMDDKPYYRYVTDQYDDLPNPARESFTKDPMAAEPNLQDNTQTMQTAKRKFSEIEQRLRMMESHVTSSRFELQRELNRIDGDAS